MRSKFVIRLLDAAGELLGWQEVDALARGDGAMWAEYPVPILVDQGGLASVLSIHWADVNVEARRGVEPVQVQRGQSWLLPAGVLLQVGPMPIGLPPVVTHGPTIIGIPVGALAAVGN